MSTTTKKDEKEIASEVRAMQTVINNLSYTQLIELANSKKDKEIEAVQHKLKEARGIVDALEAQLENLGVPTPDHGVTLKPGVTVRKDGTLVRKPAKAAKRAKGKRGAVGEAILKHLSTKGKGGAHVKDIATAIGNKPANVTAYFYAGAGKKLVKKVAPNTFALKK